jgi:hypothetical protein
VKLRGWYCSTNIVRISKSGMMRWAGHVARVEDVIVFRVLTGGGPQGNTV